MCSKNSFTNHMLALQSLFSVILDGLHNICYIYIRKRTNIKNSHRLRALTHIGYSDRLLKAKWFCYSPNEDDQGQGIGRTTNWGTLACITSSNRSTHDVKLNLISASISSKHCLMTYRSMFMIGHIYLRVALSHSALSFTRSSADTRPSRFESSPAVRPRWRSESQALESYS